MRSVLLSLALIAGTLGVGLAGPAQARADELVGPGIANGNTMPVSHHGWGYGGWGGRSYYGGYGGGYGFNRGYYPYGGYGGYGFSRGYYPGFGGGYYPYGGYGGYRSRYFYGGGFSPYGGYGAWPYSGYGSGFYW